MDESKAIELYRKYDNCRQVAYELGVSDETVRRALIKNGISRTRNRPKRQLHISKSKPSHCDSKYCAALVVMLRTVSGLRFSEIKESTGIPGNAISNIIRRNDLVAEKPVRASDVDLSEIERQYLAGVSSYDLAEKYGVNHATISKWMRKRGHFRGKGGGVVKINNKKRHEEAVARWGIENADKDKRHKRKRKQQIFSRPRDSGVTWKAIADRNGSMACEICGVECDPQDKTWGTTGPLHPSVDHIVRICDGGTDTFDNARLACCACNLKENIRHQRLAGDKNAEEQAAAHKCA